MSEEKKRTDARNGQNGQNHEDVTGTEQQESYSFLEETIKPKLSAGKSFCSSLYVSPCMG